MTASLIIVGAGGFAREALWLARRQGCTVTGFLVDDEALQGQRINEVPVIGTSKDWTQYSSSSFVVAIGSPRARISVVHKMRMLGEPEFATLIDPGATIGDQVSVMPGSIICAGVICTTNITIGQHCILNLNSTVGHDAVLADFVTVAPNVGISGNVVLEAGVEIGTGAALREKVRVARGALVGMGGVVTRDIDANMVAVGNPAKPVKSLPPL